LSNRNTILFFVIAFIILYTVESCRKDDYKGGTIVTIPNPPGFPAQMQFANEPLTKERIELGRRLFYESKLSSDGSISCGSCHQQIAAFGTYDHDLSHGINGDHSNRNAPPLFNLLWRNSFGWDGKYNRIEDMIEAHLNSPVDLGGHAQHVHVKLEALNKYQPYFKAAYGSNDITKERLLNALTQFTATMVSAATKYDSVKQNLASFTVTEQTGYTVFQNKCSSCHKEPLMGDDSFRNIGLPLNSIINDKGRMDATGRREDSLKFRAPSLRNLYKSYPFMHDGRFIAFSQVFEHYATGVQQSFSVDALLKNGIQLTAPEQNSLIEFLKTLTDEKFVKDEKFKMIQ
jgi:cytochrome c peroxidase